MIAALSRSKQVLQCPLEFPAGIKVRPWELGGQQGPHPGAEDGIKRPVRVLGGIRHAILRS
jgi:hypothetical protein